MRAGRLASALVLAALLTRLALPLLHSHAEEECAPEATVEAAHAACAVCELFKTPVPAVEPADGDVVAAALAPPAYAGCARDADIPAPPIHFPATPRAPPFSA